MSIACCVILKTGRDTGAALDSGGRHVAPGTGMNQYHDNQALADLIAGRFPAPDPTARPAERQGAQVRVRDGAFRDRRAAIDRLRRVLPAEGVEDVLACVVSWKVFESKGPARATVWTPTNSVHVRSAAKMTALTT